MNIIHVSQTPVAGAAWAAAESMQECGHSSWVVSKSEYKDGRKMPSHYAFPPSERVLAMMRQADVLVAHQGHPMRYDWWPDVPTVAVCHSPPNHTWKKCQELVPWAVIGQYQAELYDNPRIVPNLVPLNHSWYQPGTKPTDKVRIAYSPSNRAMTGYDDKGYARTIEALRLVDCEIDIIEGVPLEECLARKATAHICIDECVVGYHRSSLEALALGCVVVNACHGRNEDRLKAMSGAPSSPFAKYQFGDAQGLALLLHSMADMGSDRIAELCRRSRWWMEQYWNSQRLVDRCWMPLIEEALDV